MTLSEWMSTSLSSGGVVAFPVAFVAGVLMGLNPCCIAMYPAAAATCAAGSCSTKAETKPVIENALLFVLGNALAITCLGMIAAVAGRTLGGIGGWVTYVVAGIPIVMGLHLLGWVRLPMPKALGRPSIRGRFGAFLGGLFLSLVIGPCGTPALAAILSYAAVKGSVVFAAGLLFFYGLGNGLPLLVIGTTAGGITKRLERLGWARWAERGAGVTMLLLGFSLLWTAR